MLAFERLRSELHQFARDNLAFVRISFEFVNFKSVPQFTRILIPTLYVDIAKQVFLLYII